MDLKGRLKGRWRKEETGARKKRSFGVDDGVVSPFWYSVRTPWSGQVCTWCYGKVKTGYFGRCCSPACPYRIPIPMFFCYRTTTETPSKFTDGPQMAQLPQRFVQLSRAAIAGASLRTFFFLPCAVQALFFHSAAPLGAWGFGKGAEFDLLRGLEPHVSRPQLARFGLEVELGPYRPAAT